MVCALGASAQVISIGSCPTVNVTQSFHVSAYMGKWFEYKKYFALFQQGGECVSATYGINENGTVSVRNYLVKGDTGAVETIEGYATIDSDIGEGKLLVNFPSVGAYDSPYWILDTDYSKYSVVWACTEVGGSNLQYSWVLTRERYPDALTLATAQAAIDANGLQDKYSVTKQENCPMDP